MATILDPRFKTAAFSKKQNASLGKEMLINEVVNRVQTAESSTPSSQEDPEDTTQQQRSTTSSQTWAAILDAGSQTEDDAEDEEMTTRIRREVNQYLKEKRCELKSDPLEYWRVNKTVYPNLADLARKYHSAPPSSAAPERLFSTAKQVLKPTRLNLKPVNLEASLFLKRNLTAFGYSTDFEACPQDFKLPNSSTEPPPDNVLDDIELDNESENSDINISSDEE